MNSIKNSLKSSPLIYIIIGGLILRFLFWAFGSKFLYGDSIYISGDTEGWTNSFLNLWNNGNYTFDLSNKEAYFGRVPGFSFFWGLHYVLFGEKLVYQAVAFSHIILDSLAILLLSIISMRIFKNIKIALLTAVLYATYPFIILWTTVSYSEILSNFFNILCIYLTLLNSKKTIHYLLLGATAGLLFLTREFVAITILFCVVYILVNNEDEFKRRVINIIIVGFAFLICYLPWPLRNYYNHNRILISRSNDGFPYYNKDFSAFRSWVVCWSNDETYWLKKTLEEDYCPQYPAIALQDSVLVGSTLKRCKECGTSFKEWEKTYHINNKNRRVGENCNIEISENFNSLRSSYIQNNLFAYLTKVPFQNAQKILFKRNDIGSKSLIKDLLFSYRSLLVLLGIIGLLATCKNLQMLPIIGYAFFIYLFFSFVIRYIEMRNLVQADVLLLIPASWTIYMLFIIIQQRFGKKSSVDVNK